jgi:hypothetical protein
MMQTYQPEADKHFSCVQIDPAIVFVLFFVEFHFASFCYGLKDVVI